MGIAACGSDSSSESGGGAAASSSNADVAAAEEYISKNASGQGGPLPTSAPTPKQGLDVWVLSCAQAASGCANAAAGAVEAGRALGWNMTLVDGKGDPARWAQGVDQARVAGADALLSITVDCAPIKQALIRAKEAGMIVEALAAYDCDDPTQDAGEPLFTHVVEPGPDGMTWAELAKLGGELQAAWAIANRDGDVRAVQFTNSEVAVTTYLNEGFASYLGRCGSCEIVGEVPFRLAELGAPVTQKAQTALLKYQDANVLAPPYDPVSTSVAQAVASAGKTESMDVLGLLGSPENVELIRTDRGQAMSVGWDARWISWAAIDDIVRLTTGNEPVYSGWGQGMVDNADLPPEGSGYVAPVDYQANYEKLWKVE